MLAGVTGIGYMLRIPLMVMAAGFGMLIFAFTLWTTYWWLSIILALAGILLIYRGAKS